MHEHFSTGYGTDGSNSSTSIAETPTRCNGVVLSYQALLDGGRPNSDTTTIRWDYCSNSCSASSFTVSVFYLDPMMEPKFKTSFRNITENYVSIPSSILAPGENGSSFVRVIPFDADNEECPATTPVQYHNVYFNSK